MPGSIFNTIVASTTSGTDLATILNNFKDIVVSGYIGVARPDNIQAGGFWVDNAANPIWVFRVFDGTNDIPIFTIDIDNDAAGFSDADSIFTITKRSALTDGPILNLLRKKLSPFGGVVPDDIIGYIEFSGIDEAQTPYVTAGIKAIATDTFTGATLGTDLIFEATEITTGLLAEVMRIKNKKLGIGTDVPDSKLHVIGNETVADIKSEKQADDTTAAKFITKKKKITGTGQTISGDAVGALEIHSTDDAGSNLTAAKIETQALESHTTTAHGSKVVVATKSTGSTTLTEKLSIGDSINASVPLEIPEVVDSTTTGASQSITPSKTVIKVTNASLTSINNIASPTDGKIVILINGTGAAISLIHNTGGTAANRIMTPTAADVSLPNNSGAILVYDNASTKWILIDDPSVTSRLLASPSITGAETFAQTTTPSNPAASSNKTYYKSGDKKYTLNSAGTEDAFVQENLSQTLASKTLTTPQINASAIIQHITTPANPSAGFVKVYAKSDNLLYVLNSSGTETVVTLAGANATLSNLTSPVAINQNLLPASTQTIGSSATPWVSSHCKSRVFYGSTSGTLTMNPAATTTSYTVTLPSSQGGASSFLQNDGSGNLSWGTVGGSNLTVNSYAVTTSLTTANVVVISTASTPVTFTLPASSSGKFYYIKRSGGGTGTVTIATASGTIDGASTKSLAQQYDSLLIISDGTNFHLV